MSERVYPSGYARFLFGNHGMVKMICTRQHTSTVWGTVSPGESFTVDAGYVAQLVDAGLAETAQVTQPDETKPNDVDAAISSLTTNRTRRGRR